MAPTASISRSRRTVVIGNSGAGKSTFAARLASRLNVPAIDMDSIHWLDGNVGRKRDEAEARRLVAEVAAGPCWIIEGVYGWLAEVAMPRGTGLVWLDLPWSECKASLLARGGTGQTQFDELLAWGEAYGRRTTSSSLAGHSRIYDGFAGPKLRLRSRQEANDCLDNL